MGKKNRQPQKVKEAKFEPQVEEVEDLIGEDGPEVVEEEVDVEALNAEAEKLQGLEPEGVVFDELDSIPEEVVFIMDNEQDRKVVGWHPITKEKVFR